MTIKQQGGIFGRNPTFNDVEVEGNLTVGGSAVTGTGTIASQDADNVNIDGGAIDGTIIGANSATSASFTTIDSAEATYGVTDSVALAIKGRTSTYGTNAIAELSIQSGATTYYNGALVVKVTPNYNSNPAVEVARFTSAGLAFVDGNGIDFSATSGTGTSELFDDYEEGTWTPTVSGSSTAGTYETSLANGRYTKVGDAILLDFDITFAGSITGGGSGYLSIGGAPFTFGRSTIGSIKLHNITFTADFVALNAANGSTVLYMSQVSSGSGEVDLPISAAAANGRINGTIISYV